ncbi:MAG: hypothetical protein JXQ73_29805 [Phycisphaerae bacterium]|nr:hypothetical protein [Phycisphaerae bacterium]
MTLVHPRSLAATLDAVNESHFDGRQVSTAKRQQAARWIASRQGLPGSYHGMFAPTETDLTEGIRLFTGEKLTTHAGTSHVLGEEACRALILLRDEYSPVRRALEKATATMVELLARTADGDYWRQRPGEYCCGKCTCALWRHMTAGGLKAADPDKWLEAGVKQLRKHRSGDGAWARFPQYYTLLALSEMDLPGAIAEMRYAAPRLERLLKRRGKDDRFATRRRMLIEHVLAKC